MSRLFRLETADGEPADPPSFLTVARCGDPGTRSRWAVERVESLRFATTTSTTTRVLVVEDMSG